MAIRFFHIQRLSLATLLLILSLSVSAASPEDSRKANDAYLEGNYELAADLYQQAISQDPQNARLYFNLGNTYAQLGRVEDAAQAFEQYKNLTESSGEMALADYNMGKILADQNELESAVEKFKEALIKNPDDEDARHNYELAKKMLQQQSEQDQDQQQQDENQDQENQDQQQQNQPDDQQQNEDNQNSGEQPQNQQQSAQNNQQTQMNMDEAESILEALDQRERDLLRNQQKDAQDATSDNRNW